MTSPLPFPPPHSCDFCQKLVLYRRDTDWWEKALETSPEAEAHSRELISARIRDWLLKKIGILGAERRLSNISSLARYTIFDCTLAEARLAANAGCNLFLSILHNKHHNFLDENEFRHGNEFLAADLRDQECWFGILEEYGKGKYIGEYGKEKDIKIRIELFNGGSFNMLALPQNPASREILTRPANLTPSSEASLNQVREWLQNCLETHQSCHKFTGFMPTRLLEIFKPMGRKDFQLHLKDTTGMESEQYAALSYCWGGRQPMTTTKASCPRHMSIIDKQALPASLRDAVTVTERLGIRYLWVDALCIVQDDQIDKSWELVQMPLIYSRATVTIVASRAKGVTDGFLHDRPRMGEETLDRVFELPFRCSDNKLGSVVLLSKIKAQTEPLDFRAWALQEQFLSPRIIEYGSLQTHWICQTFPGYEGPVDGFLNTTSYNEERPGWIFTQFLLDILSAERPFSLKGRKMLITQWNELLKIYTRRSLTLGTDRLPAISGIAAHFGESLKNEYKAGLWKSDIKSQLLWKRQNLYSQTDLKLRPSEYQGPSWSWAAINEPIDLENGVGRGDNDFDIKVVDYQIKMDSGSANFSVYDTSFGAVEFASLQLRGRLSPAECIYVKGASDTASDQWIFKKKENSRPDGNLHAMFYLDALEVEFANKDSGSMPVFLIIVLGPIPRGLILRHIEGSKFSRLGVFEFSGFRAEKSPEKEQIEWLKNSPIETITLI